MKFRDIQKMNEGEIKRKLKELKLELVKSKVNTSKTGNSKIKEIKKIIARILTLNKVKMGSNSPQDRFKSEIKNI